MNKKENVQRIVGLGLLTAIVIVLQALALNIRFGVFSITLTLVPIIVGAALYGFTAGAWLGGVFGVVVLLTDAGAFLAINIPGTIATCILKGVLAGLCAGLVYLALRRKSELGAVIAAGIVAPVVNTGIFLLGCRLFFYDTVKAWTGASNIVGVAVGLIGVNFFVELIINLVLSTAIVQIVKIGQRKSHA